MINLTIDADSLGSVVSQLNATKTQASQALNSTLRKMAQWLKSKSIKGLSRHLKIPVKEVRRRLKTFRLSKRGDNSEITVWYGLDKMGMIHLKARQNSRGVTATGSRFIPHAFIATAANGGGKQVFLRQGKKRLKIDKQSAPIADASMTWIEDRLVGTEEFYDKFLAVFEHELQWRMR